MKQSRERRADGLPKNNTNAKTELMKSGVLGFFFLVPKLRPASALPHSCPTAPAARVLADRLETGR